MADRSIRKTVSLISPELTNPATTVLVGIKSTGNATARRAAQILAEKKLGFTLPTPKQKKTSLLLLLRET